MSLESPLGNARVVLTSPQAGALLTCLAQARTAAELVALCRGLSVDTVQAWLTLLASAKVAFPCAKDGSMAEGNDVALRQWEFHDLLFQNRTRMGSHDHPYGATYPFVDQLPPLPALKASMSGRRLALHSPPTRQGTSSMDAPFAQVIEQRRSLRRPAKQPIAAAQLGLFLYHVARVKVRQDAGKAGDPPYEITHRPCESGGAAHELELYLCISRCNGIEEGLYHYDPLAHELEHIAGLGVAQQQLLAYARDAAAINDLPDVLITLAARFQRVSWKYQSMALAAILNYVGAMFQQMYLVATALKLAPCALGGGDSQLFAQAAGLDPYAESAVGEFMLSAR